MIRIQKWNLILGGLVFFAMLFLGYYFFQKSNSFDKSSEGDIVTEVAEEEASEVDQDEGESIIENDQDEPLATLKEQKSFTVDAEICDAECGIYQSEPEALQYCQAVCGLPPAEGAALGSSEGCEQMAGIQKDTCLKNKAVAEKNGAICESIIDKGLRDSCRNRIAEEYFD